MKDEGVDMDEGGYPKPTFCRLEHWEDGDWVVLHDGINLLYPERFAERLAVKGKIGRVIVVDTGEVLGGEPVTCQFCEAVHAPPYDGGCLI